MSAATPPAPQRLLRTAAHACGYWPERSARNLIFDDSAGGSDDAFERLLAAGFRRSGGIVYRPLCDACTACIPVRIPAPDFRPDRAQRRCLARNADLMVSLEAAGLDNGILDLYRRYVDARHPGSGMSTGDPNEFAAMFLTAWANSRFVCVRAEQQLLAVAITDITSVGCSAVYTFFDPATVPAARGLGTFAILAQVALTRALELPHLYLGYWLDRHPNMHYKARFRPQQRMTSQGWIDVA